MAISFRRTFILPIWILVFGLLFVFSPPTRVATSTLLLVGGGVFAPALIVFLWKRIPHLFHKPVERKARHE